MLPLLLLWAGDALAQSPTPGPGMTMSEPQNLLGAEAFSELAPAVGLVAVVVLAAFFVLQLLLRLRNARRDHLEELANRCRLDRPTGMPWAQGERDGVPVALVWADVDRGGRAKRTLHLVAGVPEAPVSIRPRESGTRTADTFSVGFQVSSGVVVPSAVKQGFARFGHSEGPLALVPADELEPGWLPGGGAPWVLVHEALELPAPASHKVNARLVQLVELARQVEAWHEAPEAAAAAPTTERSTRRRIRR